MSVPESAPRHSRRGAFFVSGLCLAIALLVPPTPARAAEKQLGLEPVAQAREQRLEEPAARSECPLYGVPETVTIAHVDDGDTVRLADGRRVRLLGINAPELGRKGQSEQPYAKAAKQAVEAFFAGDHSAYMLMDAERTDRYGRVLAHLYDRRGHNLAAHLLTQGLAWHVVIPPNMQLAECLAARERDASRQARGIWSSAGIAPVSAQAITSGGYQRVRGRVRHVHFGKAWWINLEGDLSGVIYREHQYRFDPEMLRRLEGRQVELEGWVYPGHSKNHQPWRVKIETPYALEVR